MSKMRSGRIGDFFTLQRGFDITKANQGVGSIPVISSSGIASYHDVSMAKGPGVVIGRKGTLGTAFYVKTDYWPHDTSLWVKDFKDNCPEYVYYFLKSLPLEKLDSGSANPTLNRNVVHQLKASFPTPEAQEEIAKILSTLDAKIELNQRMNEELEGMAKLLYDYWFVQHDFPMSAAQAQALGKPKLAGHPYRASGGPMTYHETLKREIPTGWKGGTLEDVLTLQYGKALKKEHQVPGDYPVYGSGGIYGSHNTPLVAGPGIIVGRKGSVGELHWSNLSFYPTDTSYYVEPKAGVDLNYMYFLLKRLPLKSMNSDSAVPGLSRIAAYQLPATLPDKALIAEFGKFAAPLRATIANNEQQTQELTTLRDWLLPMLMNGQVTVG
ncbi:MAG: restriction endonuclease subunit S [Verrucomicrobiaceae bacterium]|nr:restriction endonuclease subunit S [Verrucomicrobiaceae bacterium]